MTRLGTSLPHMGGTHLATGIRSHCKFADDARTNSGEPDRGSRSEEGITAVREVTGFGNDFVCRDFLNNRGTICDEK